MTIHDRLPKPPAGAPIVWCREDPGHGEHLWRRIGNRVLGERLVLVLRCDDCATEYLVRR